MANFMSEVISIIMGIITKTAFIAFPILFMSSLLLKMNWVHYSGFSATMALLVFNITLAYGWTYILFYIIVRGLSGHYVPKCLPPYPYFMTTPQVQHINYLNSDTNGIKELPRIKNNYESYSSENYQGNILMNVFQWLFPKLKWRDSELDPRLKEKSVLLEMKSDKDCGSYLKYYDLN